MDCKALIECVKQPSRDPAIFASDLQSNVVFNHQLIKDHITKPNPTCPFKFKLFEGNKYVSCFTTSVKLFYFQKIKDTSLKTASVHK